MSYRDDMTIRPCDLVGLRKLLSWQIKLVKNLLCDKINNTSIVNNHINSFVNDYHPRVKFFSLSPFFFFLRIRIEESPNDKSEITKLITLPLSITTLTAL
eukprot:TRINITY_DN10510_c1_g2_i2.p1 TRINITY_DN10510_c1_g2~~TRINITY_DN10510_c1_g2_i2.p1  ORF type:complete len:100 (-),score=0.66 TRINITY_DN10510_c1_g2_i2:283-582(-)